MAPRRFQTLNGASTITLTGALFDSPKQGGYRDATRFRVGRWRRPSVDPPGRRWSIGRRRYVAALDREDLSQTVDASSWMLRSRGRSTALLRAIAWSWRCGRAPASSPAFAPLLLESPAPACPAGPFARFVKPRHTALAELVGASGLCCDRGRSVGLVRRSALDWVLSLAAIMVAQSPLPGFAVRKGNATPRGDGRGRRRIWIRSPTAV